MANPLLILSPDQKQLFDDNGYLHLKGFYSATEMDQMRRQFHELVCDTEGRPKNMSYAFMEAPAGYQPDPFNPKNVAGMMDQTQANDYWFDQFTEPRIVSVVADLLGPDLDFHNGKVRNKPPGFVNTQGWHQDWPYERHSRPDLAAALTYLDPTDFEAGATEVLPGSHLRGEWPTKDKYTIDDELVPASEGVVAKAEIGDVIVIHVLTVHRAGHNYTPRGRHAIINEYKSAAAIDQWNNRCAFAGLPLTRRGKLLLPRVYHPV
ncbi:MAG: phytanoyl-CoA dioxygenase family protein [Candidatus Latescibacteria bacterium]|nr:phytanoyl-CoA dioxygenase family protein [Candidatus Latescibacterota bacterium]